ncbi:MAG TPA: hypothetical protein VG820_00720 [Fimbriimonadaceae bacterium]|nr:hypothetical protein [Fimbriimonadaceae bacterium]
MRIKNKEIRARRHRKEQKQKDAQRELRAQYGDAKPTGGAATAKKPAPKPAAPKAAKKAETTAKAATPKKPAAPKAKKAEPAAE